MKDLKFPISVGNTTIYGLAISPAGGRTSRRRAEQEAVGRLVKEVFGADARLAHDNYGAPSIEGCEASISISHGAGYALLAVNPSESVGVDIEQWREALATVAGRFLSPEEMAVYGKSQELLLQAWTMKEAIFKAAGVPGLTIGDIRLPLDPMATTATHAAEHLSLHRPTTDFPIAISLAERKPVLP